MFMDSPRVEVGPSVSLDIALRRLKDATASHLKAVRKRRWFVPAGVLRRRKHIAAAQRMRRAARRLR
jgi:ribosomal protein S21